MKANAEHLCRVFRFADVEVYEAEFFVTKAGKRLALEPKAFKVLLYLLRNRGRLIPKGELLDAVWGDTAVTENSLTRNIAYLRQVLGDDLRQPRYIETVATVGYRFVCPVEVLEDSQLSLTSAESADTPPEAPTTSKGDLVPARAPSWASLALRRRWLLTTVIAVVGLLVSATWYLRRRLPPPRVTEYTQITHDARHKIPLATDGARVYLYLHLQPEHWAQVPVSGGEVTPFPLPLPNPSLLDVSPDGSSLLVGSLDSGRQTIWSVQVQGGSLRRLSDDSRAISARVISARWSPDGKLVACYTNDGDIYVMRSDGTESHKLISFPGHPGTDPSGEISWSPDGSRIRFTKDYKIWEISSNGSGLHPLLPDWHPSEFQGYGRWTPDGRFFVFISRVPPLHNFVVTPPPAQIWALDERHSFLWSAPKEPVQLTSGPTRWGWPIPGKDGKTILSRGVTLRGELVRFDAQSRQLQPYLSGISAEWIDFSPDGKFVAYVTFPEGILWKANRNGSNPTQLTDPPLYPIAPHWSPDGRQILFFSHDSEDRIKTYLMPSQGGKPQMLRPSDNRTERNPNWSPDGRRIVFDTTDTADPSKRIICILDLSNGQITDIPGPQDRWSPRWSPDGRYIAALTTGASLAVFDFKTQQWSPVIQKGEVSIHMWSRDGKFIYFLRGVDHPGVYRMPPSGGEAERIVDLNGFRFTGAAAYFMALDPEDTPLLLRDTGVDDIFALTLEER